MVSYTKYVLVTKGPRAPPVSEGRGQRRESSRGENKQRRSKEREKDQDQKGRHKRSDNDQVITI